MSDVSDETNIPDGDDVPEEVLQAAEMASTAKGIFMLRCVCHSLQLYLGDLEKFVPIVGSAVDALETLVADFASSPERAAALFRVQEGLIDPARPHVPKGLVRPGPTRWNSKVEGCRVLYLRIFHPKTVCPCFFCR